MGRYVGKYAVRQSLSLLSHFKTMNLTPDDPRLTAYALGELEGAEYRDIGSAVAADPELQSAVAEISDAAQELTSAFETELVPAADPIPIERYQPRPTVTNLPYWVAGALVAASFAIVIALVRAPTTTDKSEKPVQLVRVDTMPPSRSVPSPRPGDSKNVEREANSPSGESEIEVRSFDQSNTVTETATLQSAEVTFSMPPDELLAVASEAARRDSSTPAPSESLAPADANALQRLPEPSLTLPAAPRINPATNRPESLLVADAENDATFQIQFAVRSPQQEISEFGSQSLDSRRLFTSDPDVASNLSTVNESRTAEDNRGDRTAVFVYDRNRQNVSLRSMIRPLGPSPELPDSSQTENPTAPALLPQPAPAREPTPAESLRALIGATVPIAVGLQLPQAQANGESEVVAYDAALYDEVEDNTFLPARSSPLSTVPIDVDSASYANVRRFLASNQQPPRGAVRIEEMVNYFDYDYAGPAPESETIFATAFEVADAPWSRDHRLVRVALQSRELPPSQRPPANLVFLVDVSGSMDAPHRLPLIQTSLQLAMERLGPADRVALVVFSNRAEVILPSTPASDRIAIERAIDELALGSAGSRASGLALAYEIAVANFVVAGINRVVLTTDGSPNFGAASRDELTELIARNDRAGVALTILGYGIGSGSRQTLEDLAASDRAALAFVDSPREARRAVAGPALFGDEAAARDVRVQVEFNPARVQAYRLIGYENSQLPRAQSSAGDAVIGDVAPGHTITAFYEVVPVGVPWNPPPSMADRWVEMQRNRISAFPIPDFGELLTVKLRYQKPSSAISELVEEPLFDDLRSFSSASSDFKFASAVAAFGMVLRDSPHRGTVSLNDVATWAEQGVGADRGGYRSEFLSLVSTAQNLYVR